MIELDIAPYRDGVDIDTFSDILKTHRKLGFMHMNFAPKELAVQSVLGMIEDFYNRYKNDEALLYSIAFLKTITDAINDNCKSVCAIYYKVDGDIVDVTLNVVVRKPDI